MLNNKSLKYIYNNVYQQGKESFFIYDSNTLIEHVLNVTDYSGKTVADFGCGEGDISIAVARNGASVYAYDYSEEAISKAQSKHDTKEISIKFVRSDILDVTGDYDVVLCLGTFEHLDDPLRVIKHFYGLVEKKKGKIVIACPSFLNPRGYIWMTLQILLDVPMSLTDLHFFMPSDFESFAAELCMKLKWTTTDFHIASGQALIKDFSKRLPNALRDANFSNNNVAKFVNYLHEAVKYETAHPSSGAMAIYILSF
jgi:SAM-dependent methyltransferase